MKYYYLLKLLKYFWVKIWLKLRKYYLIEILLIIKILTEKFKDWRKVQIGLKNTNKKFETSNFLRNAFFKNKKVFCKPLFWEDEGENNLWIRKTV